MTATATATALGELRPILELVPSPLNPRKTFDKAKLEELAASITSKGIIEPLVVRERPGLAQLEIVAGERRYRAAKLAKHDVVPVIIRHLTDVEVLELMAIENSQRDDLHPLEEAEGFEALMKADRSYTPKAIAAKIGKSERYVQQRLQLGRLEASVKKSFLANEITAGHADLISRLKPEDQARALKACFHNLFGDDRENGCISVRALNQWIAEHVRLELTKQNPELATFPELAKLVETPEAPATVLQVHQRWGEEIKGVLGPRAFKVIEGKKDRCTHAQRAVMVLGNDRGKLVDVCTARTECKTHWRWEMEEAKRTAGSSTSSAKRATPSKAEREAAAKAEADLQKRQAEQRRWNDAREQAMAKLKKVTIKPGPLVLEVLRLSYFSAKTWTDVVVETLENDLFIHGSKDWKRACALFKRLGVDLAGIEKQLAAAETQTSAAKGKKAKRAA